MGWGPVGHDPPVFQVGIDYMASNTMPKEILVVSKTPKAPKHFPEVD